MSIQQAGAISNYTVIEAVGRTLASLLGIEMENPVAVTVSSPGEEYGVPVNTSGAETGTSRVNLFLYRVEEPAYSKNNGWVNTDEGIQIPFPLTLNLYYMLNIFTPDKGSNLDEHRILGDVMRVFHANQIVDPVYFEGTLNINESEPWEELKIILHPLPLSELASIWHAINKPYRLSIVYEVSVAMISPPAYKSRRVRRVEKTFVEAVSIRGIPTIEKIMPVRGYAGDPVIITGENFNSPYLKVYLNDIPVKYEKSTTVNIKFFIPDKLPPGPYYIKVKNEQGSSSAVRFEEISPFLYRLEPAGKYTEDDDFPKNKNGEEILSIWGGNFLNGHSGITAIFDEGTGESSYNINPDDITNNLITWVIPSEIKAKKGPILLSFNTQNGLRKSNVIPFDIPHPVIYSVDPEIISTGNLDKEFAVSGNNFRQGETDLYLRKDSKLPLEAITVLDIKILIFKSMDMKQIKFNLPAGIDLSGEKYYLFAVVYDKYFSMPYEIGINK
ncbi:DUF4255 domain-containing protein [Candidatus Desantisbacteria bacterium]|nr:DUF4255 domain-containing protein [Candidatus Desantisbacteria bacterium]